MKRGRSAYDLKQTQNNSSTTSTWVSRNLTQDKNGKLIVTRQSMKIIVSFIAKNPRDIGKALRSLWKEKWSTDDETFRHSSTSNSSQVQCRSEEFLWLDRWEETRDENLDDQLMFEDTSSRISGHSDQMSTFVNASIVLVTRKIDDEREEPFSFFTRQRTLTILTIWPNREEDISRCSSFQRTNTKRRRSQVH